MPKKKVTATREMTIAWLTQEPIIIRKEVKTKENTAEKVKESAHLSFDPLVNKSSI
jgi:hypothetical protein